MELSSNVLDTSFMNPEYAEAFHNDVAKHYRNNPNMKSEKVCQVLYTYYLMKSAVCGPVMVSYELHSPAKGMGFVSVTGKSISFNSPRLFTKAIEITTNFEVYPKTDGTVQMNFTFHGLE